MARYDQLQDQVSSRHGEDFLDIGRALEALGRHTDAIEALRRALSLRLSPRAEAEAATQLGAVLAGLPDKAAHEEAEQLDPRALELLPKTPMLLPRWPLPWEPREREAEAASACYEAAGALVRAGRLDEALTSIDRAVEKTPDDGRALTGKGEILRLLGYTKRHCRSWTVPSPRPPTRDCLCHQGRDLARPRSGGGGATPPGAGAGDRPR